MKPPKSKYTKKSASWILDNGDYQVHVVEWDEARNEIGIHLMDVELNSREFDDAHETALRDGFNRIFIHNLPDNVVEFKKRGA